MYAVIHSGTLSGLKASPVKVETDLAPGLPGLYLVGLADTALREARERVKAAVRNSDLPWPGRRTVVNLAPADLRKEGPALDLPISLALLQAQQVLPPDCLDECLVIGELALSGELRPVRGAVSYALLARSSGKKRILLPARNYHEARLVEGLEHVPLASLKETVAYLRGHFRPAAPAPGRNAHRKEVPDLLDVRGQLAARRALEIAAAGRHNLLLTGPPGTGKSMLASRLPGLLPPLDAEEALSVTLISSAAGDAPQGLLTLPPFRAPHHSISAGSLLGARRPGEISLAHNGVLFLDEIAEFPQHLLDLLRQPLESGSIRLKRDRYDQEMPARVQLVAARNPCPCGFRDVPGRSCRCTTAQLQKYARRVSGPLLDRIDLQVSLALIPAGQLPHLPAGEPTTAVRRRVLAARKLALLRQGKVNADLKGLELRRHCAPDEDGLEFLNISLPGFTMSARAYDRMLRSARTIADLAGSPSVGRDHISESLGYLETGSASVLP